MSLLLLAQKDRLYSTGRFALHFNVYSPHHYHYHYHYPSQHTPVAVPDSPIDPLLQAASSPHAHGALSIAELDP